MPEEGTFRVKQSAPRSGPSDHELVAKCLEGKEKAWDALIDRYKNLIYSIPLKQGFPPEDAADIFQSVCAELLTALPGLRDPQALAGWLIQVTMHKCFHLRRQQRRFVAEEPDFDSEPSRSPLPDTVLEQLQHEMSLRAAMEALTPRCQQLVKHLFLDDPPRPYDEVAAALGLAKGSIGFIRGRCLQKLRARLEEMGF